MGRWRFTWRARPRGEERGRSNGFATPDPAGAKKRPSGYPWRHESAGVLPTLFIPRGAGRGSVLGHVHTQLRFKRAEMLLGRDRRWSV